MSKQIIWDHDQPGADWPDLETVLEERRRRVEVAYTAGGIICAVAMGFAFAEALVSVVSP